MENKEEIKKAIMFTIGVMSARHDLNYDEKKAVAVTDFILEDYDGFIKAHEEKKTGIISLNKV